MAGIVIIIAVMASSGDDSEGGGSAAPEAAPSASAEDVGGGQSGETAEATEDPTESADAPSFSEPVEMVAESVEYVPSPLANGGDYVAVQVTVTNKGEAPTSITSGFFSIENANGETVEVDVVESAGQQDRVDAPELAPGDSETGVVVFPGTAEPQTITLSNLMGENLATAEVA
ncbi:DUF4352 domain-containing protein [Streptomonospora litoralis]|uniref:DUF4352 domain-containing protein n=1 Tax=Streptomonospora litoralis TaxID=2498135 RepID=UPI0010363E04|nr:DUF4352 domain-containing protein [Streptomonospora litoralis]